MRTVNALIAAGQTDPGRQRNVNEDRFHCDVARGVFMVVDGVGGQAAGGKAADLALSMIRMRLERETGATAQRIREAITNANNEIYRQAAARPEWNGMACVLTVAVIENGLATIGHVGDTRLYKLHNDRIEKVTRDHSPVGEREDRKELSELQAMRHPRRNEVYRDVGSELHDPDDSEFIDIEEIPFETNAALLLCSDGLSDQVESTTISAIVSRCFGEPEAVVHTLIETANAAGGKDNVTVVYVEGEKFTASQASVPSAIPEQNVSLRGVIIGAFLIAVGFALGLAASRLPWWSPGIASDVALRAFQVVQPGESITAAIERASPGSDVIVEPGEYRERVVLKDGLRVISRVPRGATIRLPISASDADAGPAVIAEGLKSADLSGFRIVGDAATPLTIGIGVTGGRLSLVDVEISGASKAAIDFGDNSSATLLGSAIHDNPGAAMIVRALANPRVANNVFSKNGMSERATGSFVIEQGGAPEFHNNVFVGLSPDAFVTLGETMRSSLKQSNWFLPVRDNAPARPPAAREKQTTP